MRLQTVPARQGVLWVREGFRVFARRPLAFAALFTIFMVAFLAINLFPLLTYIVLPVLPLASLGFMIATRRALDGGQFTPAVFIEPFRVDRQRLNAMIQLGIVYAVCCVLIMWLGDLVDGGSAETLVDSAASGASAASASATAMTVDPTPLYGLLLRCALAGLLAVPFWHAPALVYWDHHGCAKSLFSSTLACWRNRGAFTLYSLAWLGVVMGASLACALLFEIVGAPSLLLSTTVPLSLLILTVYYASLYFTFADCFVPNEAEALPLLKETP